MSKALLKSTGVVSAMTSLSRVTGFIRDMIYAQLFGAGAGTDAFFVASCRCSRNTRRSVPRKNYGNWWTR